jgi:hypothetical protein
MQPWGLTLLLVAGLVPPATAADKRAPAPKPGTLLGKLFSESKPKKEPVKRGSGSTSMRPPTVTAPLPADMVAASLRAEQEAWERRMSVCLRLREIAIETNDEVLLRQVDELERQATALYNVRVAALGVPNVKVPLPESAAAKIDQKLGTGVAVNPLTAPAPPKPATGTASSKPIGDVREVGP